MHRFKDGFAWGMAVGLMFFILMGAFVFIIGRESGIKRGQIEAINGNIQYELREMEDGSARWRSIDD